MHDPMTLISHLQAQLAEAPTSQHGRILEAFWAGPAARTPIIEADPEHPDQYLVTFLWQDAQAQSVLVGINRMTHDRASASLEHLPGTDVWHHTYCLDADWRGTYTFLPLDSIELDNMQDHVGRGIMRAIREDGVLDPHNPQRSGTHTGQASVAGMPHATPQPWLHADNVPRGESTEHHTPGGRRVWAHTPAGDNTKTTRPAVIVLDGDVWHRTDYAAASIDALHAAGLIRPPYLVMVDTGTRPQRMQDLSIDGTMSTDIIEDILPWARSVLPITTDPQDIVVSGESLGRLSTPDCV